MDYPYIVHYLFLLVLSFLYWKRPNKNLIKLAFVFEFLFIALRAPVVGADTWDYIRYLDGERDFYNYDSRPLEPGFLIYREIVHQLGVSRFFCMLLNSFLSCYPVYLIIKRYSNNAPLSLALMSIFNIYTMYFCALRQILGLAILFMGLLYVLDCKKRKWLVFFVCTAVGYTFHTTIIIYAAIFLCAYFINFKSRNALIAFIVLSAVFGIVLQSFNAMDVFNIFLSMDIEATSRIDNYMQEGRTTNEITSVFMSLRPTIIAVFIYSLIAKEQINHVLSKAYAIGVILQNLFISVPMVNRFTFALCIFGTILFTWIFSGKYIFSAKRRRLTNIAVMIFICYFSQSFLRNNLNSEIDLMSSSRMHPYYFIWQDYRDHPSIKYYQ